MALIPELVAHSATATRLHPRPGDPTAADSSIGGPLLWPAAEPWPICEDGDNHYIHQLRTPTQVRRSREIYAAARARDPYDLTDSERAELRDDSSPPGPPGPAVPLVPVAQIYRRDVPGLPGPADADLLQVLWCPLDHPDEGYNPRPRVYWRRSADVTSPLGTAPEPPLVSGNYLPNTCVVHPEPVLEYQYLALLPAELRARVTADLPRYQQDLSLAPGWKIGGLANWSLTDPYAMICSECGTTMTLLLTAASGEWAGLDSGWRPREDPPGTDRSPAGVLIGRFYSLYIFSCPASPDHPSATAME